MIIRYPTGLFTSVLPVNESDDASVVFTISTDPPRPYLDMIRIPPGVADQQRRQITPLEVRPYSGELLLVSKTSTTKRPQSGSMGFVMGQVIDFSVEEPITANPKIVSDNLEFLHRNNNIDLSKIGLSSTQSDIIKSGAQVRHDELLDEMGQQQELYHSLDVRAKSINNEINEINRLRDAINVIISTQGSQQLETTKLQLDGSLDAKRVELSEAISQMNGITSKLEEIRDNLSKISLILG